MPLLDFNILWVSKCTYPPRHIIKKNSHDYCQIVFVLGGDGRITVGNITHCAQGNQMYIINSNVEHGIEASNSKSLNTVELKFYCNDPMSESLLQQLPSYVKDAGQYVRMLFTNIIEEIKRQDEYTQYIIESLLNQAILFLARNVIQENINGLNRFCNYHSYESDENKENTDLLDNVARYIRENYYNDIKLNDLANIVHLSPVYFCSVFKAKYGVPPMQYLQNIRLENAKKLLIYSNNSITMVSEKVGFQSVNYFSRFFKA